MKAKRGFIYIAVLFLAAVFTLEPCISWADASPAARGVDPWTEVLPGAEGSQLGLYSLSGNPMAYYKSRSVFIQLKISPTSIGVYYSLNTVHDPLNGKSWTSGSVSTSGRKWDLQLIVTNPAGKVVGHLYYSQPYDPWYRKVVTDNGKTRRVVTYYPITGHPTGSRILPITSGDMLDIYYPSWGILHAYSANCQNFSFNPDTFNTNVTYEERKVNTGQVVKQVDSLNNNYFEITGDGIREVGYDNRTFHFKDGAEVNLDPDSDTFSISKGSGSSPATVTAVSPSGQSLGSFSTDQSLSPQPFDLGGKVTIKASPSDPITSVTNSFTGAAAVTSGYNLDGSTTLVNRDNEVQAYWQPSSQNLPFYRYMLFKYLGPQNFNALRSKDAAFFSWLSGSPTALNEFLTSGYASATPISGMGAYKWDCSLNGDAEFRALQILDQIWEAYPASHSGEELKIAIATSLDFSSGVQAWLQGGWINPLQRYEIYASAFKNGTLMGDFVDYSAQQIRDVVDVELSNKGLKFMRSFILSHDPVIFNRTQIQKGWSLIQYIQNSPFGNVQRPGFYGPRPYAWDLLRYSGVCGAASKTSAAVLNAFGEPAYPVGQPGHCAYIWMNVNHIWCLGYNIMNWAAKSVNRKTGAVTYKHTGGFSSFLPLTFNGTQLNENESAKGKSYLLAFEAERLMAEGDSQEALKDAQASVAEAGNNLAAWNAYIGIANQIGGASLASEVKNSIQENFSRLIDEDAPFAHSTSSNPNLNLTYSTIASSLEAKLEA